jgi:hypothetical protein
MQSGRWVRLLVFNESCRVFYTLQASPYLDRALVQGHVGSHIQAGAAQEVA